MEAVQLRARDGGPHAAPQRSYEEIIYIDETTFNLWQRVSKCWLQPGMKLSMLKFRGHSIILMGAISLERGLIHYEIFDESNNADRFGQFLTGLKNKCQNRLVAMVQDNLRIHYSKALQETYGWTSCDTCCQLTRVPSIR